MGKSKHKFKSSHKGWIVRPMATVYRHNDDGTVTKKKISLARGKTQTAPPPVRQPEARPVIPDQPEMLLPDPPKVWTPYDEKKLREVEGWAKLRNPLLKACVESLVVKAEKCGICNSKLSDVYRCMDCSHACFCCEECIKDVHKVSKLHCVEKLQGSTFLPSDVTDTRKLCSTVPCCGQFGNWKYYTLIDSKGRPHNNCEVTMCACQPEALQLWKLGFFPVSPTSPELAVSIQLLDLMTSLTIEGHMPAKAFVSSIKLHNESFSGLQDERYKVWDRVLKGEALSEFRVLWHKRRFLPESLEETTKKTSLCPACPSKDGSLLMSLDANFGLVHKKNSGVSVEEPQIASQVFLKREEVIEFMDNYQDSQTKTKTCSNFQAGNVLRSKNQARNLTTTGVFGAVCKHEVPNTFLDMTHGERLGYAVQTIKHILDAVEGQNVSLFILYDIACMLSRHLKKSTEYAVLLEKASLAIPVFHAYGHKMSCQKIMNARRSQGFGLNDGEQLERLWSYLRPFSRITKEQTPSHRLDLLSIAILHYTNKKVQKIEYQLHEKMEKAISVYQTTLKKQDSVFADYEQISRVSVDKVTLLEKWIQDDEDLCNRKCTKKQPDSWEESYAADLLAWYSLREKISKTSNAEHATIGYDDGHEENIVSINRLNSSLSKTEKNQKIKRWARASSELQKMEKTLEEKNKVHLLEKLHHLACEKEFMQQLKVYINGQKLAKRICSQLTRVYKLIKTAVNAYNCCNFHADPSVLPHKLTIEDVALTSNVFQMLFEYDADGPESPDCTYIVNSIKEEALRNKATIERAKEEQELLQKEMKATWDYFVNKLCTLHDKVETSRKVGSVYHLGLCNILNGVMDVTHKRVLKMHTLFKDHIPIALPDTKPPASQIEYEATESDDEDLSDVEGISVVE